MPVKRSVSVSEPTDCSSVAAVASTIKLNNTSNNNNNNNNLSRTLTTLEESSEDIVTWPTTTKSNQNHATTNCKQFTPEEYDQFIKNDSVYKLYEKAWQIQGCVLSKVCGRGGEFSKCPCVNDEFVPSTKLQQAVNSDSCLAFASLFNYLVPQSLPYMMQYSEVVGPVCTTPFFSVVCSHVKQLPNDLFMLSNLNLTNVVTNSIFRHELVFNPELYIKDPSFSCLDKEVEQIWVTAISEIEDLRTMPLTYGPLNVLPQLVEGLRVLLNSLLPDSLGMEVDHHLDPNRLLCGDEILIMDFVEEFIRFICAVCDACVIPQRRRHVDEMKFNILKGVSSTTKLVKGIMMAVDLLNFTKVDQINARIKERASMLYATAPTIEKSNFINFVEKGGVDMDAACEWLHAQPTLSKDILSKFSDKDKVLFANDKEVIYKLVNGFVNDFLCSEKAQLRLDLFYLDNTRIRILKRWFKKFVLRRLACEMVKLYPTQNEQSQSQLKQLLSVPEVYKTKLYALIEQRCKNELVMEVFSKLCDIVNGKNAYLPADNKDSVMLKEMVTILSLHWSNAQTFYCQ